MLITPHNRIFQHLTQKSSLELVLVSVLTPEVKLFPLTFSGAKVMSMELVREVDPVWRISDFAIKHNLVSSICLQITRLSTFKLCACKSKM